jgi:eukaryotic-like serine/threonine-protein kinase
VNSWAGGGWLAALLLTWGLIGMIVGLNNRGLIAGLMVGMIVGLNRGGSVVIRHYALRLILWRKGSTPFKLIQFLDHCSRLIFLKKVGGGYLFIHRFSFW